MKNPGLGDRDNRQGVGVKYKNPGNRTGNDSVYGSGTAQGSHNWTVYSNWTNGYAGNCLLLLRYLDGTQKSNYGLGERNPCMASIIFTWCPPSGSGGESLSSSQQYVASMCRYLGIEADDRIAITENNLVCIELAKGMIDSGCVHNSECRAGVKMCLERYVKDGGHLDTNENLGKVDSQVVKNIIAGVNVGSANVSGNVGGSSGGTSGTTNQLGADASKYTNGTGTFSGTEWGKPIDCGTISASDVFANSSKGGREGVVVGTHLKQQ